MERADQQLISDYLGGDNQALEVLVRRYLSSIRNFVYRLVGSPEATDDITQEIFFKVWRNLSRYNDKFSFRTWIYQIARNASIDWLRKKKLIPFSAFDLDEEDIAYEPVDEAPLPDELFARQELGVLLEEALAQIDPENRSIILLHLNDNLTFAEIAEVVGRPINTVKSRYRRALLVLRSFLMNAPK